MSSTNGQQPRQVPRSKMPAEYLERRARAFQLATASGPGKMHTYGTGKEPANGRGRG